MYLAVAVETKVGPSRKQDYKIWYLEISGGGKVQSIGVKTKEELLASIFENYKLTKKTNWRCFQKDREKSTPIEIFDFIAMNAGQNTHFGNLPTLSEFQGTLHALQTNLELKSIA
ncbi:MAG: hypothetical protein N4A33_10960 [Bacteriovoracaceae bacterium]|jgi:hypothetical protein|nr:hypothetical protein [Bacteriovoracaceae bacterium]